MNGARTCTDDDPASAPGLGVDPARGPIQPAEGRRTRAPWGSETLWAETARYAAKILEIDAGHRTSLQHHADKEETMLVLEGRVLAHLEDEHGSLGMRILEVGDVMHVPPGRRHRLEGLTAARIVEVSTPELDDVVRHHDDYGRSEPRPRG